MQGSRPAVRSVVLLAGDCKGRSRQAFSTGVLGRLVGRRILAFANRACFAHLHRPHPFFARGRQGRLSPVLPRFLAIFGGEGAVSAIVQLAENPRAPALCCTFRKSTFCRFRVKLIFFSAADFRLEAQAPSPVKPARATCKTARKTMRACHKLENANCALSTIQNVWLKPQATMLFSFARPSAKSPRTGGRSHRVISTLLDRIRRRFGRRN